MNRILVKSNGKEGLRRLHVVVGEQVFKLQLWWEIAPWFLTVASKGRGKALEVGNGGEDLSCLGGRVESEEEKRVDEGISWIS